MKRTALTILSVTMTAAVWAQSFDRSIRPKPGPAPEIKLGNTESFTLPNGLRVFVVENHKLPVVSVDIQLDIKPELEGNKTGYRQMMSDLMTSGTKTRSNEKLNKEIDYIGANVGASDDELSASGLKKHQEKLLELIGDIATNADFKQTEFDKIKTRTLSGLEAEKTEPDAMLQNVTAVANFGTNHPYGEVATEATVKNITLADARNYYSTYFRPNVAYMAIVGDVTMKEVKPLVEKYFGGWQKADVPVAHYSNPTAPATTHVFFAPREGAVQSVINVSAPIDLQPGTPDVIKAKVANAVLGGGSMGRLFLDLREKHGWTYGSYSSIRQDDLKGSFTAFAKARNVVSDSSVGAILDEMRRLQTEKVPQEELQNDINNLSGTFALSLENPKTIAQYAINIERYHMPKDYYQNYLKNLAAVTADDVQAEAQKYMNPDHMNIIVVGSKDAVAKTLEKFDSDHTIAYYNNYGQPLTETQHAAAPSNVTVADIMKNYIKAIGGEKAVMGIKDIKTINKGSINAGGQEYAITVTEMKKMPDMMKSEVAIMGMVQQKQVFNGTKGYVEAQGQKKDMEGEDLEEAKAEADITADLHPEKYGIVRTLKGMDKVNDADAYVVEAVNAKGGKTTEYYDAKTGLLVKKVQSGEQGSQSVEYSDYQEIPGAGGYKIPYTVKISAGGQSIPGKVETVEVNKNIPDTEFN